MKRLQQGFTLIELMIVVAIVGILAAIALPAYQDYVIRSKLSEGEAAIAACKTSVSEYVATHAGTFPADEVTAGCSTTSTQYVNGGTTVNNGIITAVTQNTGAAASGGDCTLILNPTLDGGGTFAITKWTGTFGGCPSKYIPSAFR